MHLNSRSRRCAQGPGHVSNSAASDIDDNITSRPYLNTTLNLKHVKPAATVDENSPKPTEYTVGWICALPIEMAAAEGMLDEVFQAPGQGVLDENIYVVGRIAHLKTVIVCLPYRVAGTTSATRVAEHMRQTFTALQYTLLVGVGGGMPSKEVDVRLGDVVVSAPSPNSTGVVQYDYGKDFENDRFVTTGHLNKPPDRLLIAVSRLECQEASRPNALTLSIAGSIARLQARYSNSERNWSYPGESNDLLFNSGYNHEGGCLTCARCDADYLEERPRRGSTQPKIHYGTIASANRVMRNGAARERLRLDKNALCVEMEAAGLMNNFPCLVIRGICDYADSHKNKDWQPYAAATAAAFAKELLSVMPKHI
ncbi:purine uridine phosphorylase [Fusarium denticulatum]|uniref:Purine uridine phosphorylase n=1 Tax=Fusarium denticulatum TaxID=48507 RepID=A0A8H6CTX2_9HYPO|nr:purine uridine phosphorylase [Fusarium denticulatum]